MKAELLQSVYGLHDLLQWAVGLEQQRRRRWFVLNAEVGE